MSPPKVLEIQREFGKFGRDAAHQRNEMAYVQAVTAAKSGNHYFAATAASGTGEAWFIVPHDSWEAYEKSLAAQQQEPLRAQLAGVMERDSEFVSNGSTILASYDEKSSYHANVNIAQMRYFEIETIRTRMGHDKDWEELVKLFSSTLDKANLDVHYAVYNVVYGAPAGTVLIFTPHKSLGELDSMSANFDKAFSAALGPDGQKRMSELTEAAIATDVNNLFAFDPKMSYPPEEWVQADSFWKPAKAMPKAAKAMAKKPAPATQP
ncbi:MAG TPA: hypothetical protein VGS20_17040 [Candidatus Acidoferrales bacterium]|nr:hypothetical protein [Candidatus Acidoferrales bacterium]